MKRNKGLLQPKGKMYQVQLSSDGEYWYIHSEECSSLKAARSRILFAKTFDTRAWPKYKFRIIKITWDQVK